ncbi:MAG: T9SS type A sorting domain-containing protein [Bacteroidota bacterium]|nr:T9SS type A sorting domain-containing protein [Bacteroidota bacterium]MDP4232021.1 T9SS type A sorting domain-containing protein [Bacteroidota bacterium]MDP4241272.1 T9SS type A sorting domain-containing protein [Bacteroidota bacterium]MDP4286664.1 T9SS type A sorting domain-containing protein [Bacteroidota bacterium]
MAVLALVSLRPSTSSAQAITYLLPDIGTPGMNTYIEIIGPNKAFGNFGTDSIYANNPGDRVQVICKNPSDTNRVKFGPCVVSWNGRMIATQVFVMPWVQANATDWRLGIKIPICVIVGGSQSNTDTFYIVKPQSLGVLSTAGLLGSGGAYGFRSRRGAMIVDSMILTGSGMYGVSTSDCDPTMPGIQGYLPFTLISLGPVRTIPSAQLDASANGVDAGPGGGGGGNGLTCGTRGGNGFTGGGGDADWQSGCGDRPAGIGTGPLQNSLNFAPGGVSSGANEGGGGGTGHAFGTGGAAGGAGDYGGGFPGYGGGSGGPECCVPPVQGGGGGGGFATAGSSGGFWQGFPSGGYVNGNLELVPMAGGSGGGGGNDNGGEVGAGNGGGGGGCLAINARSIAISGLIAKGAIGSDDTSSFSDGAGGGGSGGAIILGSKISLSAPSEDVHGGSGGQGVPQHSGQDGGNGGAGRVRLDGLVVSSITVSPNDATRYAGPSTDTSHEVNRTFTITGTGNGKDIQLYLKPLSDTWSLIATITGYATNWSRKITLPGSDTLYLLAAAQQVPSPSADTFAAEPGWVLSQAAANIFHVSECIPPVLQLDTSGPLEFCDGETRTIIARPIGLVHKWLKDGVDMGVASDSLVISESGLYSVVVSTTNGCADTAIVTASVTAKPKVQITANSPIRLCAGDSATIHASSTDAGVQFMWLKDGSDIQVAQDSITIGDSGQYSVIVSKAAGCTDTASVQVILNPLPIAGIAPSDTITLDCANQAATIAATGGNSYLWSNGANTSSIVVSDTGLYSVLVTDSNGCSARSKPVAVRWQSPLVTISSQSDTTICADSGMSCVRQIQFTNHLPRTQAIVAHSITSSGFHGIPDTIVLAPNETQRIGDTLVTDGSAKDYHVAYYFTDSCGATLGGGIDSAIFSVHTIAKSPSVQLEMLPDSGRTARAEDTIAFPIRLVRGVAACLTKLHISIAHDGDLLRYAGGSGLQLDSTTADGTIDYVTLQLSGNAGVVASIVYQMFLASKDSTPLLLSVISSEDTCTASGVCPQSLEQSASSVRYVFACTDRLIQDQLRTGTFYIDRIAPNPARNEIQVSGSGLSGVAVEMYDMLGRSIALSAPDSMTHESDGHSTTLRFDVSQLPDGFYHLRIAGGGLIVTRSIVIQR